MSSSGKQAPLGVNALTSLLKNVGLNINPPTAAHTGVSHSYPEYSFGSVVNDSGLYWLTYAIRDAWCRKVVTPATVYYNLYTIGGDLNTTPAYNNTIPALGNSRPITYKRPGWPNWNPYTLANPYANELTSWGYVRLFALQAWNEFNYNSALPYYGEFLQSFINAYGFVESSNQAIMSQHNSKRFLDSTYSNMNDLMTADVSGVNMATTAFGQDLVASGKAIDLESIATFGLPINLLRTLRRYNTLTKAVSLALVNSGISHDDLLNIMLDESIATSTHQKLMYQAFLTVKGDDLAEVLITLNCKTPGLTSLADLLNPKKLMPNSYSSLTVPLYNKKLSSANSKTYYPIYEGGGTSSKISTPAVVDQVGTMIPSGTPKIAATTLDTGETLNFAKQEYQLKNTDLTSLVKSMNIAAREK